MRVQQEKRRRRDRGSQPGAEWSSLEVDSLVTRANGDWIVLGLQGEEGEEEEAEEEKVNYRVTWVESRPSPSGPRWCANLD